MIVTERFSLRPSFKRQLREQQPNFGFGMLGAAVYYRTYSRLDVYGNQESWADTVIRVIEGWASIEKWWRVTHKLPWKEREWNAIAEVMANAMFNFRFLPSGRNLWAMGAEYTFERGGLALNNCQFVDVVVLSKDIPLIMDSLMSGVGTGFGGDHAIIALRKPKEELETYVIEDTREAWVESLQKLIESYEKGSRTIAFDYSKIRPAGEPIRGFGGVASGSAPLQKLHERTRTFLDQYLDGKIDRTRLVADIVNCVGACVVAGI